MTKVVIGLLIVGVVIAYMYFKKCNQTREIFRVLIVVAPLLSAQVEDCIARGDLVKGDSKMDESFTARFRLDWLKRELAILKDMNLTPVAAESYENYLENVEEFEEMLAEALFKREN